MEEIALGILTDGVWGRLAAWTLQLSLGAFGVVGFGYALVLMLVVTLSGS